VFWSSASLWFIHELVMDGSFVIDGEGAEVEQSFLHNSSRNVYPVRYRAQAFLLTYLAYVCFHLTRKVPSVVKSTMHPLSATGASAFDAETDPGWAPFNQDLVPFRVSQEGLEAKGAVEELWNGEFQCNSSFFTNNDPCKTYVNNHEVFIILSEDCPLDGFPKCWTMEREKKILYAQGYGGDIPAKGGHNDAADYIHWKKKGNSSASFERYDRLETRPKTLDGGVLLGLLDSVFLGSYTVGLFVSGYVGDRVDRRYFLTVGMLGSSLATLLLGAAYRWKIHSLNYFIVINVIFGLFQSIGWPTVLGIMGAWFGHESRGLILGIWNSHTSVGNILGSTITAASVDLGMHHEDWPLGFEIPGLIMMFCGVAVFVLLIPRPSSVGLPSLSQEGTHGSRQLQNVDSFNLADIEIRGQAQEQPLLDDGGNDINEDEQEEEERSGQAAQRHKSGGGFLSSLAIAAQIPGLVSFALSLMFCKLCAYSLLYWGPYYLSSIGFSSASAGYLCSFFDVGGVAGGIVAGLLSDLTGSSAAVAFVFQLCGIPAMAYYYYSTSRIGPDVEANVVLMMMVGFFVNAPYALITTAVSADLGSQVKGDAKLLSLVSGIIDGTGSFGAMVQGVLVGTLSSTSWASVWHFLMVAQGLSALMVTRLVFRDWQRGSFR